MEKKRTGIYQILCIENNKRYIGASINLAGRKRQHFSDPRLKKHRNPRLQRDVDFLGVDKFIFSVLEIVSSKDLLLEREQFWIDLLCPEYNAEQKAGYSVEHVKDDLVRQKISASVKKLWQDPEYREKCSVPRNWKNGIPNRRGVKLSDETKHKIREANLGKKNPNYGKPRSQSFIDKMSKTYSGAISPDGIVYSPIIGLTNFCREHNLDTGQFSRVLNGKAKSHRGWTRV